MVSFLISLRLILSHAWVEDVPSMPLSIKLFFNQLYDFFLLTLYSSLLLSESIEFGLPFSNFLSVRIHVSHSCERILVPNI